MRADGIARSGMIGLMHPDDDQEREELIMSVNDGDPRFSGKYRDDISGQVLRDDLVEGIEDKLDERLRRLVLVVFRGGSGERVGIVGVEFN